MTATRPELTTATVLAGLGIFQAALAAGAPWGRAAYGGTHDGTLPRHLRMISGAASVAYGTTAVLAVRGSGTPDVRRTAYTALSVFMGLGTLANAASRSPVERAIWTPVAATATVSAWRARRHR
ncbi:hypothetical protein HNR19_002427 [Nocardioides thalensis]|uniref:DUF4345 domain-containing protein n=1 Tax=Nocardioides thalensis TaxID=1914755 RepID=A0A853C336_9ACTN|nr:hypothetical protein [Nocardioides thalensis]NYJ01729.1 hypothetical protein [Nocardioides thalensis]